MIRVNETLARRSGSTPAQGSWPNRAAFEQGSTELTEVSKSGLTVVPLYAEQAGGVYDATAPDDPALSDDASLGVDVVPVGGKDYSWHQVSGENADTYVADVVLDSMRDSLSREQLQDQPTFARLPAAQADQLDPWKFVSMDYPSQTTYLRELAGWLGTDRKVT